MKEDESGLQRQARLTRGRRLSRLLEEEVEADDEFWNQDAFRDDEVDNEYEEEEEQVDEFDSDFNDDEEDSDGEQADEDERRPMKKRKLPPGKKPLKKGNPSSTKKKGISFVEEAAAAAAAGDAPCPRSKPAHQPTPSRHLDDKDDGEVLAFDIDGERTVRKSTRTAVVVKQAEREAQRAALQAIARPVVKKKKGEEERKMTQEEMLLEAAQTGFLEKIWKAQTTCLYHEIQNRQSLEIMLAREEEVKRKAIIHKEIYSGPQIRFHSKNGVNILEFTKVLVVPEVFSSKAKPYPKASVCVITGLPAKYRDPQTGLPYATRDAFKVIRERLRKGEKPVRDDSVEKLHQRKRTKVEREKPGPGGRTFATKLKFKIPVKPISEEAADSNPTPTAVDNTVKLDSHPGSMPDDPTSSQPLFIDISANQSMTGGDKGASAGVIHRISTPVPAPPVPPLPRPMVEANEADFMLEDLEVSLPSNLESSLSLPTSGISSSMVHTTDLSGVGETRELQLEHEMLDLSSSEAGLPRFSEGYDLGLDVHSHSNILSLDVSWLQNS